MPQLINKYIIDVSGDNFNLGSTDPVDSDDDEGREPLSTLLYFFNYEELPPILVILRGMKPQHYHDVRTVDLSTIITQLSLPNLHHNMFISSCSYSVYIQHIQILGWVVFDLYLIFYLHLNLLGLISTGFHAHYSMQTCGYPDSLFTILCSTSASECNGYTKVA